MKTMLYNRDIQDLLNSQLEPEYARHTFAKFCFRTQVVAESHACMIMSEISRSLDNSSDSKYAKRLPSERIEGQQTVPSNAGN
jgi:hypothetical protein